MREYPRRLFKGNASIKVFNEQEEYDAGVLGFECHRSPEIAKQKEADGKGVLRVNPAEEAEKALRAKENAELEKIVAMQDSLIERAMKKLQAKKPGRKPKKEVKDGENS